MGSVGNCCCCCCSLFTYHTSLTCCCCCCCCCFHHGSLWNSDTDDIEDEDEDRDIWPPPGNPVCPPLFGSGNLVAPVSSLIESRDDSERLLARTTVETRPVCWRMKSNVFIPYFKRICSILQDFFQCFHFLRLANWPLRAKKENCIKQCWILFFIRYLH